MAVTRIWPIKGRLRNVIDYTVNPEKTFNPDYTFEELQALKNDYTRSVSIAVHKLSRHCECSSNV